MKTNSVPRYNELSNNFKSFIFGFSKEECVSVRPKIWVIKPGGVEGVSGFRVQKYFPQAPLLPSEGARGWSWSHPAVCECAEDQVEAQDQGVTPVNLGEGHKVLSVSEPPIVRVVWVLEPLDPEHVAEGPDEHKQGHDLGLPHHDLGLLCVLDTHGCHRSQLSLETGLHRWEVLKVIHLKDRDEVDNKALKVKKQTGNCGNNLDVSHCS